METLGLEGSLCHTPLRWLAGHVAYNEDACTALLPFTTSLSKIVIMHALVKVKKDALLMTR